MLLSDDLQETSIELEEALNRQPFKNVQIKILILITSDFYSYIFQNKEKSNSKQ
jgi:hypothetical protein